jgi:PadR family transcriptional regulator AphA
MELTNTSQLLLGMVALEPQSGYDIKQMADASTRHFWQISYGQIYPELKELEGAGYIEGSEAARGSRQRTLHELTPKGKQALREWIADASTTPIEMRDEMLLKLFFSDSAEKSERIALARAMSQRHRDAVATLQSPDKPFPSTPCPMRIEVLMFGIGLHTWCANYFADLADRLEKE